MLTELQRSFALNLEHATRLLEGLTDQQMVAQPLPDMNHPAWIVGHLTYSLQSIGGEIGLATWLPPEWSMLFGTGSVHSTDPGRYPSKTELLERFTDARQRISDRLAQMTEGDLNQPLPDERHRDVFPTVGTALLHILTVHAATHIGQLSAWRRAMGLPPVGDPL